MRTAALPRATFQARKPARAGRPAWKVAEAYLRWLRKLPCACGDRLDCCSGATEAAHVDLAGKGTRNAKGLSSKVADRHALPLSAGCHRHQHQIGWLSFEKLLPYGDAEALAARFWHEWPGRAVYEREQAQAAEARV